MCVCTYVCMYVCMFACMYACMYVCMYVRMYVCMYIYIYTYLDAFLYSGQGPKPLIAVLAQVPRFRMHQARAFVLPMALKSTKHQSMHGLSEVQSVLLVSGLST